MVFQMPMESFDSRCTLGDGIGESLRNMGISRTETRRKVEELLGKMRPGKRIRRPLSPNCIFILCLKYIRQDSR